jgi:8-oxo-dGTP diphosphatase
MQRSLSCAHYNMACRFQSEPVEVVWRGRKVQKKEGGHHLFTIGVFAVIVDERQQVLLCHRGDIDRWNLPGGRVELGETPWQALVREVKEEVGIEIIVERLVGVYAYPPANDLILSFACRKSGGELTPSAEADAIAFFPADQLPANTHRHHAIRIRDFFHPGAHPVLEALPLLPVTEFGGR